MRPYWKGYLKLALVSCPIALHSACSSDARRRYVFRSHAGRTAGVAGHPVDARSASEGAPSEELLSWRRRIQSESGDAIGDLANLLLRVGPRVTRTGRERVDCNPFHLRSWRWVMERRKFTREFKLEAVPDQGSRRVLCASVAGPERPPVATARLGEEVVRGPAACFPWPRPDEAPSSSRSCVSSAKWRS
jgi:hypothetical protein